MLLYVIRHGDPIYNPDTLTEKGKQQAKALAKRLAVNGIDRIYCSPLGRAKETAQPTCELLGLEYEVEDWTSESLAWNDFTVERPGGGKTWCFHLQSTLYKNDDTIYLNDKWHDIEAFHGANTQKGYERIIKDSDEFLRRQGYERQGSIYKILKPNDDRVAVFCHQGFGLTWISHLLNIPPHIFWASFDITHSGVSIFHFKNNDDGFTSPKCLCLSDVSHIYKEGLPMQYNNGINI